MNTSNRSNYSTNGYQAGRDNRDWHMTLKCYGQAVGKVNDQFTDLLAKLKKGRDMLTSGQTGVTKERPLGTFAIEKLRQTGRVVLEVVDEKDQRIGQPTIICAEVKRKKFMTDERTGLVVPASDQDTLFWRESLKLAISVVQNAIHYVELGKLIEQARQNWDNVARMGPIGEAIQTNLGFLGLEEGEEQGILRQFLTTLVWPAVNGRAFKTLEEGFSDAGVAADGEGQGGCWIYAALPEVMQRVATLQTKELADLEMEASKKRDAAISKPERKEMLAVAQGAVAAAAVVPEVSVDEPQPTDHVVEAVAAPQDA